jgi:tape measure domain-containing protein
MAESNAKVTGDFSSLVKGSEDAARSIVSLAAKITGIAAASKAFDVATTAISGTVNILGKIGLAAQGVEAIGKSAVSMAQGLVKGNAALEMTTISFKTLLGSAQAADDMIEQLTQFAASTPFELTGLEANTQKLLAFGFSAKDIIPLMTSLGDAISALGGTQDNLNSLVYVMGQMRGEAHINAGDIMQMVNQGIPALQMLADHYHKTTGEIQEMISKGLIPGKEAVDIFTQGLEQKYGGMMAAQSSTFNGMLSNLQDWASATMITLTKPFFEPAKKALKAFLDFVQSPAGVAVINHMAAEIQLGVDKATAAFVRFEPQIKPTFNRLLQVAEAIRSQMTPGIITLIPLIEKLWTRFEPLALSAWKVYQAIQPMNIALAAIKGFATGGVTGALDALRGRFNMLADYAKKGFDLALDAARKFGPALLSWVGRLAFDLARTALQLGEALVNWVLPKIPLLLNNLLALGGSLISWVLAEIPIMTRYLLQMASAFVDWVLPIIPRVLNALGQFVTQVLNWVEREVPVLTRQFLLWTDILAGWIIPAIPGVIRSLEVVGAAIVDWGLTRLPVLIGNVIVGIGQGLGVNLRQPVNDVLKIFNSLVSNIRSVVLPAFLQMVSYLRANVMPLFDQLSTFIAGTLIPTAASLAAFVMTTLVPVFVNIADILGQLFGPALTLIGSIIRNELLPALTDSWNYFDGKYMPTVRDLASALGEKLADGIRLATDKFKEAVPKLDDFYKKIEPIVGKALDLYKAISPISIALDVLKGLVTGGLQGGLGALEQHVVDLGKVFGLDLQPVIDWFNDTVVKNVIPTLKDWAKTFIDDWWPKIRDAVVFVWNKLSDFWTFVSTKIWPPFSDFLKWLGEQWGKVGKSIGDTWETTIKPALKEFVRWIGEVLWPKLRDDVFPWIDKHVRPKLESAFSIIADVIVPNIGKLVDIILNHVIPALVGWWGVLFTLINPFLKTIGDAVKTVTDALGLNKDNTGKAMDGYKNLVDTFKKDVLPILDKVATGFHTLWTVMGGWLFEAAFKAIGNIIEIVGDLGDLIDKFSRGDYPGAVAAGLRAVNVIRGHQIVISGDGGASQQTTSQQQLANYIAQHPNYDPAAAGNAPKKASGDRYWRGGLVEVGERGAELIKTLAGRVLLATRPTTLNLPAGAQIFNAQQTLDIFQRLPASPQQISNMYQNSHANTWDNSINHTNSHNNTQYNYYGQQGGRQMSPGMQRVWYGRS